MRNCVECCEVVEIDESGRGQIRDYYRNIDDEIIWDELRYSITNRTN